MDNTQNLGQPVGKVTTTYNGEKIQVNVYADRSVILPDGTVRKVKQEVVDALIAKNQAMNPASTIVWMAPAKPPHDPARAESGTGPAARRAGSGACAAFLPAADADARTASAACHASERSRS